MHISKLTTNSDLQNLILDIAKKLRTEISQDEAEFIIKQKPFYPMLKNNLYDPLKSILKSIAFDLTVAGDIRNSMRDLLFNNELETKIDLYIQFLAEYFIDDVLGRKVGSPESQNLNEKLKPVSTSNFRSFYHRVVYIKSYKMLQMFKDSHFETTPESDGVLVYGYIDQTAGLSFKGLCCANIDPNGEIQLCSSNTETSLTIRAGLPFEYLLFFLFYIFFKCFIVGRLAFENDLFRFYHFTFKPSPNKLFGSHPVIGYKAKCRKRSRT